MMTQNAKTASNASLVQQIEDFKKTKRFEAEEAKRAALEYQKNEREKKIVFNFESNPQ